jgi:serine/threonine protein kinase
MADVYRARDELLGRRVALKVFRDSESADDLRRQHAEVQLLATMSHPNLVTLYDAVAADDGRGALVLEYVEGGDLRSLLGRGPLHAAATADIGRQVADALAYIHARGVIHRDVSPSNILLSGSEQTGVTAKIADLGIARLVDDGRITATGVVIGTARYMSPEQARGERVSPSADVYSLGLVLLESLTGRREFPGTAVESAAARLARDPVVPPELAPEWRRLLRSMTDRDPRARPSADAASRTLREVSAPANGATDRGRTVDPAPTADERTHPMIVRPDATEVLEVG